MAPLATIPNPVTAYQKWAQKNNDYVHHYLDDTLDWRGITTQPEASWRKLYIRYKWTGSTDIRDDCFITLDISNFTAGALDSTWTTADYTSVEAKVDTFVTAIAAAQNSNIRATEYRWYVASFNDYDNPHPFAPHGGPERVTVKSIGGTGGNTAQQIPQASMTVTLKTPYPRNWGRNYIPGLNMQLTGTPPQFASTLVDSICAGFHTFNTSLHSSDFQLTVPVTSLGVGRRGAAGLGSPNRRLTSVTSLTVDSTPDVQRRRRQRLTAYKKTLP